jgi:hypothetical protein
MREPRERWAALGAGFGRWLADMSRPSLAARAPAIAMLFGASLRIQVSHVPARNIVTNSQSRSGSPNRSACNPLLPLNTGTFQRSNPWAISLIGCA